MAVVDARDLHRHYGETVALDGVSLSVEEGEIFGLIGPNGAGKTTLVRALTGTTVPDDGTVRILEQSPTTVDRDAIAVLPQDFSPPARLTARELIEFYAGLYDSAREPATVLGEVGLEGASDTRYENLSGGQQRRLCVGTAIVNEPTVLFLDEPTTGIDPAGRRTVWRLIERLVAEGTTVVLTTHDMAEAERLSDRVALITDGRLVAIGAPPDLVRDHGGTSYLTIETAAEVEAFDGLGYPVEAADSGVRVDSVDPEGIGTVIEYCEQQDVSYTGLSWTEPSLEDVYLTLAEDTERDRTGRALEEAA
ncbi:MAG: ABC transporter ATP-binding protein [Natrialbaceae archaeon]|nr:ABC transporter ATP-binding protein [Natrialbaceae archaeon]